MWQRMKSGQHSMQIYRVNPVANDYDVCGKVRRAVWRVYRMWNNG